MSHIRETKITTQTQLPLQPWLLPLAQPDWSCSDARLQLETVSECFDPINLAAMDDVALLDRIDKKYVMTTGQLLGALAHLQPHYWMLDVDGQRLNHYRTLYFDTAQFDLYNAHIDERAERYKVRGREYMDSHLSFLEVKHHTRKGRTIKDRIAVAAFADQITAEQSGWLREISPLEGRALRPTVLNTFTRMTLVSKQGCERVTLDVDVAFSTDHRLARLDGIAIAEVKIDVNHRDSFFVAEMRKQRVRQQGFSKYAFGVAALYDMVKKNTVKPKMLWVKKLMKGSVSNDWIIEQ